MAKIKDGILGPISGKLGPIVGSSWKGISYIRSAPRSTGNKRIFSAAQLAQQAKFKFLHYWLEPFHAFVNVGFAIYAKGLTEHNAAYKLNYREALQGVYPDFYMDYGKVCLSRGILTGITVTSIVLGQPDTLKATWEDYSRYGEYSDQIMLVIYCPALKIADGGVGMAKRSDYQLEFKFNAKMVGHDLEVFISMVALNRKKVSNSEYLGRIVPL